MKRKDQGKQKEADGMDEDSNRPPDAWERFRILLESIDQARRITEIDDRKARYALVLIGIVNAAMILLGTRADFLQGSPAWLKPWLLALLIPYIAATFAALWFAIDCLRPRHLTMPQTALAANQPVLGREPLGLLFWEGIVRRSLEGYQRAWDSVTMGQLNTELEIVAHTVAQLNRAKYTVVRRMYAALLVVIAIAAVLLALDVWFAFLWDPIIGRRA